MILPPTLLDSFIHIFGIPYASAAITPCNELEITFSHSLRSSMNLRRPL